MPAPESPQRQRSTNGFAYFMLRVHRAGSEDPSSLTGVIERLGTGEKQAFHNGEELLRLLRSWPGESSKMQRDQKSGNAEADAP